MSSFYPGGGDPELGEGVAAAEAFALESKNWANKVPDTVDGVEFSSKKYSQDSSTSAGQAATSAADAAQSAQDAEDAYQAVLQQNLEDLNNVTITSVATSEVLTWSGTQWVNSPASGGGGATLLNELLDVDTTGVSNGQVLLYSGGTWQDSNNFTVDPTTGAVTTTGGVLTSTLNATGATTLAGVTQGATTMTGNLNAAGNDGTFRDLTMTDAFINGAIENSPQVAIASSRLNSSGGFVGANYGISSVQNVGAGIYEFLLVDNRANMWSDCSAAADVNYAVGGPGVIVIQAPVTNPSNWIRVFCFPVATPATPTNPADWGITFFDAGRV